MTPQTTKNSALEKKRRQWPRVRETVNNGEKVWLCDGRRMSDGKRIGQRHFFATAAEADAKADQLRVRQDNEGAEGLSLTAKLRQEAAECAAKLAPLGVSLTEAVNHYLAHVRQVETSRPVNEVIAAFLQEKKAVDQRSSRYLGDLRTRLSKFELTFGAEPIASLSSDSLSEWLAGLSVGAVTRNTFRRRLAAMFSFAKHKRWVAANPFAGGKSSPIRRIDEPRKKVRMLSNEQAARILETAAEETLPFWAIALFAGLRPESELCRLTWADVDFEQKVIVVDGAASEVEETKTGRRVVKMADNLIAWLQPFAKRSGRVAPAGDVWKRLRVDKRAAGFGTPGTETPEERKESVKLQRWVEDFTRHTYGSNHLAEHGDIGQTATQMGNSPGVVRQRYLALVKPREAKAFWQLKPAAKGKVVPMRRAA